jgi:hypothetical protein
MKRTKAENAGRGIGAFLNGYARASEAAANGDKRAARLLDRLTAAEAALAAFRPTPQPAERKGRTH